jgi:uncharacterized surface protein with fasciclin (FAS1) repeats
MTIRRPHLLLCSLIALTVTFAGCASTEMASTPANVVAAVSANPELTTFAKLIKQAGLEGALEGAGPVTVFAPSDEAFKSMPAATLDKLTKDPEHLKSVLNYHVLPGLSKAADFDGSKQIATVNGAKVTVSKAGDFLTVDDALVTKADMATGNGVVHVIDRLLTPPKK